MSNVLDIARGEVGVTEWPPKWAATEPKTAPTAVPASRTQAARREPPRLACMTMTAVTTAQ